MQNVMSETESELKHRIGKRSLDLELTTWTTAGVLDFGLFLHIRIQLAKTPLKVMSYLCLLQGMRSSGDPYWYKPRCSDTEGSHGWFIMTPYSYKNFHR
jgi:hypothetical protein